MVLRRVSPSPASAYSKLEARTLSSRALICGNSSSPVQSVSSTDNLAPGLQLILDRLPKVPLLDAAPEVLLLDAAPFDASKVYHGSSNGLIDMPELDWVVRETPTVHAFEAPKAQPSDAVLFDVPLYPSRVLDAGGNKPFVPVVPDDDIPQVWHFELAQSAWERTCLKQGQLRPHIDASLLRTCLVYILRVYFAVAYILIGLEEFAPYTAILRDAWRAWQERRRYRRHGIR